jgi:MOSC domain-containing protein YiiM
MLGPNRPATVESVQVGRVAPLGPDGVTSGFVKSPVAGPVEAMPLGLRGDEQADLTVHGGLDKAVYFYPSEHYPRWGRDVPRHTPMLVAGAFGENITTAGLDEDSVSIGDVLRIGTAELQVTQPRQPCFKLGLRFDDSGLGRLMLQSGRTGWYTRVIIPGTLAAGDEIHVVRRPNPAWTIARFNRFIPRRRDARSEFAELAALEGLAEVWKQAARDADDRGER